MKSKRPRVVFCDFVTHYGGAQRSTAYLLGKLNDLFDVYVLDPYGVCPEYLEVCRQASVPITVLHGQPQAYYIGGSGVIQRAVSFARQIPDWMKISAAMMREVDALKPDVVLTNSYKGMALLWLSGVTKLCSVVYYARGWYQKHQIPWLGRWFIKKAACVLAVSNATAEAMRPWLNSTQRVHVCHTVIDFESVSAEAQSPPDSVPVRTEDLFKILMPAQLLASKGQTMAVEAAAILKQHGIAFVLWLAGDTKMGVHSHFVEGLRETINQHGLQEHVVLLGHRSDVRALMSQANVVILPSQTEGFPRALWEAMILRCPVVATPAGGVTDLIEHGKTGLLVPFGDAQALAVAIQRLAKESGLAARLAQEAFENVTQTFSEDITLTQINKTLMCICEG